MQGMSEACRERVRTRLRFCKPMMGFSEKNSIEFLTWTVKLIKLYIKSLCFHFKLPWMLTTFNADKERGVLRRRGGRGKGRNRD